MKRLRPAQMGQLLDHVQRLTADGDTPAYRAFYARLSCRATVTLPAGELLNPAISGFTWAWAKLGVIEVPAYSQRAYDGIAAQPIESLLTVQTELITALLVASEIGVYRLACWLDDAPMRRLGLREGATTERDDEEDEDVG